MMVSQELAEFLAEKARETIVRYARKMKLYAEHHNKKILKKEMAELIERQEKMG